MKEFKVYHFNWRPNAKKSELITQMKTDTRQGCDSIMAKDSEKAVKFYIKEHGLPSNDAALIGVEEVGGKADIVIASTNARRTCTVVPYNETNKRIYG